MVLEVPKQGRALHARLEGVPQLEGYDAQAEYVHLLIVARPPLRYLCKQYSRPNRASNCMHQFKVPH